MGLLRTLSKVESQKLPKPETWQSVWAPRSSADFPYNETFVFLYIRSDPSLFLYVTTFYCSSTMDLIKEPGSVSCYLLLAIRRLLLGFTQDFSSQGSHRGRMQKTPTKMVVCLFRCHPYKQTSLKMKHHFAGIKCQYGKVEAALLKKEKEINFFMQTGSGAQPAE